MKISTLLRSTALTFGLLGVAAVSSANSISFTTSAGVQPSNVGVITLTEVNATTVNILVDLLPGYGFVNTGGPHTPFAFNLLGTESGVSITSWTTPTSGGTFSLNLAGGDNDQYGRYGVAIDSSSANGAPGAYYGDLNFDLTRTSGLGLLDFTTNTMKAGQNYVPGPYYFSADLIGLQGATGAQAWNTKYTPPPPPPQVPDSGASVVLLGLGLVSLALFRRKAA